MPVLWEEDKVGMKARLIKKRYKKAATRIANKCPLAFKSKREMRDWVSEITCAWVREKKVKRDG